MINSKIKVFKNILLFLFIILIFKFLLITVYYEEGYTRLSEFQTNITVQNPMPRGEIFDRKDRLIVGNKESINLIYLGSEDIDNEYEWSIAQKLSNNLDMSNMKANITENDYKDLVIRENYYELIQRINNNYEKYGNMELDEALKEEINESDYKNITNKYSKDAIDLKILMDMSSVNSPKTLLENISVEEQYYIEQNLGSLGGSFIISDWERYYPYDDTLRSFLGTVGDIPQEEQKKYKNLGYSSDDQVGVSYIEKAQEDYLKPTPQEYKIYFDEKGNIVNYKIVSPGSSGYDIKLTIDIELQEEVDKILSSNLKSDNYKYYKTNYSSIIDVNTGELLVLAGKYKDKKEIYDISINNFTTAYEIGSVIKPIVLLTGYQTNTWKWGKHVYDQPMDLGGVTKASYNNYGDIDEYGAILHSSNVYFYTMALQLAGIDFWGGDALPPEIDQEYFDILRTSYSQFGLGEKTGIGFDNELEGVKSSDRRVGLYMDMANGQYDTYTPLQMTQYAATIANGQYRMKVNYLYSINNSGQKDKIGKEIKKIDPEVLNVLDYAPKDIKHVQDTLIGPTSPGGTAYQIADSRYQFAAKTGTSESFYYEPSMVESVPTNNTSLITYAPYKEPEIAMSVIMPYWTSAGNTYKTSATEIGGQILDACYDAGYID